MQAPSASDEAFLHQFMATRARQVIRQAHTLPSLMLFPLQPPPTCSISEQAAVNSGELWVWIFRCNVRFVRSSLRAYEPSEKVVHTLKYPGERFKLITIVPAVAQNNTVTVLLLKPHFFCDAR